MNVHHLHEIIIVATAMARLSVLINQRLAFALEAFGFRTLAPLMLFVLRAAVVISRSLEQIEIFV